MRYWKPVRTATPGQGFDEVLSREDLRNTPLTLFGYSPSAGLQNLLDRIGSHVSLVKAPETKHLGLFMSLRNWLCFGMDWETPKIKGIISFRSHWILGRQVHFFWALHFCIFYRKSLVARLPIPSYAGAPNPRPNSGAENLCQPSQHFLNSHCRDTSPVNFVDRVDSP